LAEKRATRKYDNSDFAVRGVRWTQRSNVLGVMQKISEFELEPAANRNSSLKL